MAVNKLHPFSKLIIFDDVSILANDLRASIDAADDFYVAELFDLELFWRVVEGLLDSVK